MCTQKRGTKEEGLRGGSEQPILGASRRHQDVQIPEVILWWNNMKKVIAKYVNRYLICLNVKVEYQRPLGELQPLEIPARKWEFISMDFVVGLPLSALKKNVISVIVDRLTKSIHFLPIQDSWGVERLAKLYVKEIVRRHGIPSGIVSDRNKRFQAHFW